MPSAGPGPGCRGREPRGVAGCGGTPKSGGARSGGPGALRERCGRAPAAGPAGPGSAWRQPSGPLRCGFSGCPVLALSWVLVRES